MRMLWFLLTPAYKNLTRYRRRTIITNISIALGLAMFLIIDSVRNLKWFENSLLRIMHESYWDDRVLLPLGMGDRTIRLLFMLESGGIGLFGSIYAIILGSLTNILLVANGIDFGYRVLGIFRGEWSIRSFIVTFLAGIVLAMMVAWVSTRRAVKQEIPSFLRHQ